LRVPVAIRAEGRNSVIDRELLEILACPLCKAEVRLEQDRLVCTACGRRYPIRDDIPVMLVEEAELPAEPAKSGSTGSGS
jgi:uncharacterized protein YbaR (Trm112 family)